MMSKSNGTDMSEWARAPPESGPVLQRIAKAIYNPEEKSFLGRTPKRWGIAITFYLVFYAVLALMFALCMGGLFLSLDERRPTYTLERSLIGSNPGVTARPVPPDGELRINHDVANSTDDYVKQLTDFFRPYENDTLYKDRTECVPADNFGYPDTPCLFVKLNRILDWEPQFYNNADDLPDDFPEDLAEHIRSLETEAERSQVWVACFDEAGNTTKVEYPWGRALPGFQPFRTGATDRNPILAVKLTPAEKPNTVIRCRVLAKNVIYNRSIKEASGYARVIIHVEGHSEDSTSETTTDE